MVLFLKLFGLCGLTFGTTMSLAQGGLSSPGDFAAGLALYGIPFGLLTSIVLVVLHRRGERPELEKRDRRRGDARWESRPRRP